MNSGFENVRIQSAADQKIYGPVHPTLFVGLGGTGLKVLARVRRRLYEQHGSADHWPIYAFLGVDSDLKDINAGQSNRGTLSEVGIPLQISDIVQIWMPPAEVARVLAGLRGEYAYIGNWLPGRFEELDNHNWNTGAKQNRAAGRMLFIRKIEEVKKKVLERCTKITGLKALEQAQELGAAPSITANATSGVDVVMVASIAGGTGAGCTLDFAYLLRSLGNRIRSIGCYLVMPDVFQDELPKDDEQRMKTQANGFAFLRELEYYNRFQSQGFSTEAWGPGVAMSKTINTFPFQVCYLVSKGNEFGTVDKIDEVYDMLGESIAFSLGTSPLANTLRSQWSNAQDSYLNELRSKLDAQDASEGGSDVPEENKAFKRYERRWSRRYSSLGISSISLKLPELQRLGGARLMRRIVLDIEMGTEAPEREVREEIKLALPRVATGAAFVGDFKAKALAKAEQMPIDARTGSAAQSDARDLIASLDVLIQVFLAGSIDAPSLHGIPMEHRLQAEQPIRHARDTAEQHGKALEQECRKFAKKRVGSLTYLVSLLNESVRLIDAAVETNDQAIKKAKWKAGEDPAATAWSLVNWRDADQCKPDPLGQRGRAITILRRATSEWLVGECQRRLTFGELVLRGVYLRQIVYQIKLAITEVGSDAAKLREFAGNLATFQDLMARAFLSVRNQILTAPLAAQSSVAPSKGPGGREQPRDEALKEQARLDAEIERAIERLSKKNTDHLRWARDQILAMLAASRGALPRESVFDVLRLDSPNESSLEAELHQAAEKLLAPEFPAVRDIYQALKLDKKPLLERVENAKTRATAYWPLDKASPELYPRNKAKIVGLLEKPGNSEYDTIVKNLAGDWVEQAIPLQAGDNAAGREITFVSEMHGFALQSLDTLKEMRQHYQFCVENGKGAPRHLDSKQWQRLPDLSHFEDQEARETTDAWDLAFFAVLVGQFKWPDNPPIGQFIYDDPEQRVQHRIGQGFESAARWLRANDVGKTQRASLEAWRISYLKKPIDGVLKDPKQAEAILNNLLTLDLTLELLGQREFKPERPQDGAVRYPPHHTMIRRLQKKFIQPMISQVVKVAKNANVQVELKQLRTDCAGNLHRRVKFVGLRPDSSSSVPVLGEIETVPRLLSLLPTPLSEDDGKRNLDEAFEAGWFKDYPHLTHPAQIHSFFPDMEQKSQEQTGFTL